MQNIFPIKKNLRLLLVILMLSPAFFLQPVCAQDPFSNIGSVPAIIELLPPDVPYRDITINKDWSEAFFTMQGHSRSFSAIVHITKKNGKWSAPAIAKFSGQYNDLEPSLSPDGKRLYFVSNRPTAENPDKKDTDIWYVEKTEKGWSDPINLGAPVNTTSNEFYPTVAANGSIYFTAQYERAKGSDIYYSKWEDNKYITPVSLSAAINEPTFEINPFISPTEKFIIFSAYSRTGNIGSADLFISLMGTDGNWQPAVRLPEPINSASIDYCPFVSADEKFLFFTSARAKVNTEKQNTYEDLIKVLKSKENGLEKVYAVTFDLTSGTILPKK